MYYPKLQELERYREMTTVFGGYNHQISCAEGQFFDMKNMTSSYYPVLSPRKSRGIIKDLVNPQGILSKEDLWWIDDKVLYKNGEKVSLSGVTFSDKSPKTMTKMGAVVVVLPDKIWFNAETLESGYMENSVTVSGKSDVMYALCDADGSFVNWHDAEYYESNKPKDGDYLLSPSTNGMSLKIYSASTGIWSSVATTYIQISARGIGKGFNKDDGVKIYANTKKRLSNVLVNREDDGRYSVNTYIVNSTDNSIVIPGIISPIGEKLEDDETEVVIDSDASLFGDDEEGDLTDDDTVVDTNPDTSSYDVVMTVAREMPDMDYVTECGNRLWGGSKDGHEIYCCKLGDVTNWNSFKGISTDSWAATVGSDGKFTGAITYLGYPMLFKEDSFVKIAISTTGGHQTKETVCRGVQKGSGRSLAILNETLFYKSPNGVCGYNGSLPFGISDELGTDKYYDAVAGAVGDKYYISMRGSDGKYDMFAYDVKNGLWCREDDTQALFFCKHKDDLFFVNGSDKRLYSVGGTIPYSFTESGKEEPCEWFTESGAIGYSSPDYKYCARINLRITLEAGTSVDFYVQYDSCGEWEHKFNMSGKGTRAYSIPFVPRRCDHFKYRIVGKGDCKIHSITKTIEEGSDL